MKIFPAIKGKAKSLRQYADLFLGIILNKAGRGPISVQIDLTNRCNNSCLACWCRSPFVKMPKEWEAQEIKFEKLTEIITELSGMGVREVYLTGGGEPLMHPRAMEIIRLIKSLGMRCDMSTNFTLADRKKIREFVKIGVEHINVSIWAGSASMYSKLHPRRKSADFAKIAENLKALSMEKKKAKSRVPYVNIHNVILSENYKEIDKMVEFSFFTGADSVDFTPVDTIPHATDKFALTKKQCAEIFLQSNRIRALSKKFSRKYRHNVDLHNYWLFAERMKSAGSGLEYDFSRVNSMPCYSGWSFLRIMANGNVIPCLKAHRMPSGNIYKSTISEIWNGKKQNEFRRRTIAFRKEGNYFKKIGNDSFSGCSKGCDNIEMNSLINRFAGPFVFRVKRK